MWAVSSNSPGPAIGPRGLATMGVLLGAALAGCSSPAVHQSHDPCAPPPPAARSLDLASVWKRPPAEPPLTAIREVGNAVAVCSRRALHLLRPAGDGQLDQVAVAALSGCRRMASNGAALAVLEDRSVAYFPSAGSGSLGGRQLSSLPASAHDLALTKSALFVAADDGVHRLVDQSGTWTEQGTLAAGHAVRAVATDAALVYAGEPGGGQSVIERYPAGGGAPHSIKVDGLVEHLVVQGEHGLALEGGFGLVTFPAGAAFGGAARSVQVMGSVNGARIVGDDIVAENRISLVRVGPLSKPIERALHHRDARGSPSGGWFEGMALEGGNALALRSSGVDRVTLATWSPRPLLVTDRAREDIHDAERSVLLRVMNQGSADLVLGAVRSDNSAWSAAPSHLNTTPPDAECPSRLRIAPDAAGLLDMHYAGSAARSSAVLTLTSNDSDQPDLRFPVSRSVPPRLLSVGDAAPDFTLPLLGGGELGLGDLAGHVAYLKFFSPG